MESLRENKKGQNGVITMGNKDERIYVVINGVMLQIRKIQAAWDVQEPTEKVCNILFNDGTLIGFSKFTASELWNEMLKAKKGLEEL